jgi:hypothetical protein
MATGTAAPKSKAYHTDQVHYMSRAFTFADDGSELELGWVPANSYVLRGGVVVKTAFDAGTTNVLDIGTAADPDGFATDLALGTIGVIVADEMATTNDAYCAAATKIVATVDLTGTAATAGAGLAWVEYIVAGRQEL